MKVCDFHGFKIISNPAIPEGTIFVSPKEFIMLRDPEKWQEMERKKTKDLIAKVDVIFGDSDATS